MTARLREIPYNYTSFSDREIVNCILVEITKQLLGKNWFADYFAKANRGGIERVLL